MSLKNIEDYYNNFWRKDNAEGIRKNDYSSFEIEARNFVIKSIENNFNDLNKLKILEIGSGLGYSVLNFAKLGANVTAIDISQKSLDAIKEKFRRYSLKNKIKLVKMDAHKLKFKNDSFDVVFIQTTLMHLNYIKVAMECKKVIKKNGLVIFFEPLNDNVLIRYYRDLFSKFKKTKPNYLKFKDIIGVSKNFNKFKTKGFYLISFFSLLFRDYPFFYKLISNLSKKFENILIKIFPKLEKYCWINVSIYKK